MMAYKIWKMGFSSSHKLVVQPNEVAYTLWTSDKIFIAYLDVFMMRSDFAW